MLVFFMRFGIMYMAISIVTCRGLFGIGALITMVFFSMIILMLVLVWSIFIHFFLIRLYCQGFSLQKNLYGFFLYRKKNQGIFVHTGQKKRLNIKIM